MIARPRTAPGPGARLGEVIPYDYGAVFPITGRPGNVVQSVINTAPDSLFVAVAIGYGFEEDRGRALSFELDAQTGIGTDAAWATSRLGELPASALIEGFRVNPRSEHLVFREDDGARRIHRRSPAGGCAEQRHAFSTGQSAGGDLVSLQHAGQRHRARAAG